jgi:hypothetical protein
MKVRIDKRVIEQGDTKDLRFLLDLIGHKIGCTLLLDEPVENIRPGLSEMDEEMMKEAFGITLRESLEPDCEVKMGAEQEDVRKEFSLKEAILYLKQPLDVLVENNLTDPHLLRAISRCYEGKKDTLKECECNGDLSYENGGGCTNMGNWLEAKMGSWQNRTKFLRLFVVMDSDKRYPTDSSRHAKLENLLNQYGIPYHVWHKRSMENYLPAQAYSSTTARMGQWKRAYEALEPEQRDYYCVAEGFKKDLDARCTNRFSIPEIENLYQTVGNGNYQILLSGCPMGDFKTSFPALFDDARYVNRKTLDEVTSHQTHPDELMQLLEYLKMYI